MRLTLPTDSRVRKDIPVVRGFLNYFPAAVAGVAGHSKLGNDKHNPGEELHHSRGKSNDHADCIVRHVMDIQDMLAALSCGQENEFHESPDALGEAVLAEANALAWRSLAFSQELHEKIGGAPLAPAARLPETSCVEPPRILERFKPGDRVKITKKDESLGNTGTIRSVVNDTKGPTYYGVELDTKVIGIWNGWVQFWSGELEKLS